MEYNLIIVWKVAAVKSLFKQNIFSKWFEIPNRFEFTSCLIWTCSRKSTLFLIISFNWSNLLDSEFIFTWHITNLFIFFNLNSFKCFTVSQGSVFERLPFPLSICFIEKCWSNGSVFLLSYFIRNFSNKELYFPIKLQCRYNLNVSRLQPSGYVLCYYCQWNEILMNHTHSLKGYLSYNFIVLKIILPAYQTRYKNIFNTMRLT